MTVRNDVSCVKALSGFIPIWVEPRESGSRPFQGRELFVLNKKHKGAGDRCGRSQSSGFKRKYGSGF